MQWDEVSEDGCLADLNIAQPLKYEPFRSIHEDYSDRIEDLLNEVDLEESLLGGVQNFTMSCLALHAMQEYGWTMQVEEDKARIANPRRWPVSKDDLRSLKEDIELRIFQISKEQQRLELKDRWKSHYNEFTGRSVDGDQTDLYYPYLDDDRFIVDGNDVYLDVSPYSVSVTVYPGMSMGNRIWQPQTILRRRSKIADQNSRSPRSKEGGFWTVDGTWFM